MVYNLVLVQQSAVAGTTNASLPLHAFQNPLEAVARPTGKDLWVNSLWFSSLAISLSAALIAVLTKQWLYHYMSPTSGTAQERTRLQQFRHDGLEKYRVPVIVDFLPVALHLSIALFLVGLALFLSSRNIGMTIIVSAASATAYIAYLASIFLPLMDPQCPYQSPISSYLYTAKKPVTSVLRRVRSAAAIIAYICISRCGKIGRWIYPQPNVFEDHVQANISRLTSYIKGLKYKPLPPSSSKDQEGLAVLQRRHQLDIDAITWLHLTSSNSTVRDISFQAVVGLMPSDGDTSRLRDVIRPYYQNLLDACSGYTPWFRPVRHGREADYHHLMQAICITHFRGDARRWTPEDVEIDDEDAKRVFNHVIIPSFYMDDYSASHRYQQSDFNCFIAPGSRSHVRLPLSVWVRCLSVIQVLFHNPVTMTHILREWINSPHSILPECGPIETYTHAVRRHSYLRSLFLDSLFTYFEVPKHDISSPSPDFFPVSMKIIHRGLQLLTAPSDLRSQEAALSLLTECFKTVIASKVHFHNRGQVRDACHRVVEHELTHQSTAIGWAAYEMTTRVLNSIWMDTLSCPRDLLHALLAHLGRSIPSGTIITGNPGFLSIVPKMIKASRDRGIFFDMLREQDHLPLDLARAGGDDSYRSLFWGSWMCECAVFSRMGDVDVNTEWAVKWITYIEQPERLFFLFKTMLAHAPRNSLAERVKPLLELTGKSHHWETCFGWLVEFLEDDDYMGTIESHGAFARDAARRDLSNILVQMQSDMLPALYPHRIPRFNKHGNLLVALYFHINMY